MKNITKNLQFVLLTIILISTVIAVGIEIKKMFLNQTVTLADLLLMFLYLEVMAMVRADVPKKINRPNKITINFKYFIFLNVL